MVGSREEIEAIDDEEGALHRLAELILGGQPKHEVGRIIREVGPSVVEVVFGIERLIADKTIEQPGCGFRPVPMGARYDTLAREKWLNVSAAE